MAFTLVSRNRKTGPIPVSLSSRETCPRSCRWYGQGCYAAHSYTGINWRRLERVGLSWEEFIEKVRALPTGQLWRHNEAGDLAGRGSNIDGTMLRQLVEVNRDRKGFTYTHKPVDWRDNLALIRQACEGGFAINLSADTVDQADHYADLGVSTTVVLPEHERRSRTTPAGRKIIVCPAATGGMTCKQCRLCAVVGRKFVVGFPAHGPFKSRMTTELVQLRLFG